MGGLRPPKDWLQRQKREIIKKVIIINSLLLIVTYMIINWNIK